jgi:hypothetical protein
MAYKGVYRPSKKYSGNPTNVIYRSLWERQSFIWCDRNPDVVSWSSEEIVIPYRSTIDGKIHRYYMDLKIEFTNGTILLVEIKPYSQTIKPKRKNKTLAKYIQEVKTWGVNTSKWDAAYKYAKQKGWIFKIWTEKELNALGIQALPSMGRSRPRRKASTGRKRPRQNLTPLIKKNS